MGVIFFEMVTRQLPLGEIFGTILEAKVVIECWRREYNQTK
jgi:hypothetical protein